MTLTDASRGLSVVIGPTFATLSPLDAVADVEGAG
jgi:hypothetical protein